jgi:hypothetical protein
MVSNLTFRAIYGCSTISSSNLSTMMHQYGQMYGTLTNFRSGESEIEALVISSSSVYYRMDLVDFILSRRLPATSRISLIMGLTGVFSASDG